VLASVFIVLVAAMHVYFLVLGGVGVVDLIAG